MFEKCTNCQMRVIKGCRDENGVFCSRQCQGWFRHPGYCPACAAATTDEGAGNTHTVNGIGTHLYWKKRPCPVCGSIVQTKFFCVFFLPLVPLGRYRVRYVSPGRYLSRKLNPAVPQL